MENANIPKNVTRIQTNTYNNCRSLKSINIPDGVTHIEGCAFFDCKGLSELTIPGNCVSIGNDAFSWCTNINTLTIEDGEETLDLGYAYSTSIYYQGADKPTWRGLFADCPIKNLYFGRNITTPSQGDNLYTPFRCISNYCTENTGIRLPTGKTFDRVTFGDYVTDIPSELFKSCIIEESITLPKNLKTIGNRAFYTTVSSGVLEQTELTFPETLTSIGEDAFTNGIQIRFIYCNATVPPTVSKTVSPFGKCSFVLIVPQGCVNAYNSDEIWAKFSPIDFSEKLITINVKTEGTLYSRLLAQGIQTADIRRIKLTGLLNDEDWAIIAEMGNAYECDLSEIDNTEIPSNVFTSKGKLMEIKLPKNLTSIKEKAFYECKALKSSVVIPESCNEIGEWAFCKTLIKELIFSGNAVNIGAYAFRSCSNINELNIIGNGTVINAGAFSFCNFKRLTIGKGVELCTDAFDMCREVKEIIFEDGVKKIQKDAFYSYIPTLVKVVFKGTIESIEEVQWSSSLKEVHVDDISKWCKIKFPTGATNPLSVAKKLYIDGSEANILEIPDSVSAINNYAFYHCDNIKKIILNKGLKNIGIESFFKNYSLEEINFPSTLSSIGINAFAYCKKLDNLDFPLSIGKIDSGAFSVCTGLNNVTAHWTTPIKINTNTFSNISSTCCLHVPILTAAKYKTAGWNFATMKEEGILSITTNLGGVALYEDQVISNCKSDFVFTPYTTLSIEIKPDEGYFIESAILNKVDISSSLENNIVLIEEPDKNQTLIITFDKSDVTRVDNIIIDNNTTEYYNLSGMKISNPQNGLYIEVRNGTARKVLIK